MVPLAKWLSRRTVLRGAGATVALPLLDAMFPAFGWRARQLLDETVFVPVYPELPISEVDRMCDVLVKQLDSRSRTGSDDD